MATEKRLPPSARKLRRARADGDVAKSRDLTGAVAFLAGILAIYLPLSPFPELVRFTERAFAGSRDYSINYMLLLTFDGVKALLAVTAPVLGVVLCSVLLVEFLQAGFTFSLKPLVFRFERLDPVAGFRRMLGLDSERTGAGLPVALVFQIGKMVLYLIALVVVLLVCGLCLARKVAWYDLVSVLELGELSFVATAVVIALGGAVLLVGAIVDYFVVVRARTKRLSMDVEEFRREYRENEGSPETRAMRKQLHQELTLRGIVEGVRRAKVVVVSGNNARGQE